MPEQLVPPDDHGAPHQPGLSILAKADRVLRALEQNGELTVAELAEVCDEPTSSLYRLLATLTTIGWVNLGTSRGSYRLGLSFVRMASEVDLRLDIRRVCAPSLERLNELSGETTYLIVRSESQAVCIERLEGTSVRSLAMRLGGSLPLNRGGGSLVLMAFSSSEVRHRLQAELRMTASETARMADRVTRIRENGVAWSEEDVTPGIAACAGAVFNFEGDVAAAISVSGSAERLLSQREQIETAVREAAAQASWAMGWDRAWPPELAVLNE